MASPASACNEMKKVATPIEMNNKTIMAGIETSALSPKPQNATNEMTPAKAK